MKFVAHVHMHRKVFPHSYKIFFILIFIIIIKKMKYTRKVISCSVQHLLWTYTHIMMIWIESEYLLEMWENLLVAFLFVLLYQFVTCIFYTKKKEGI